LSNKEGRRLTDQWQHDTRRP